jgi:hypothetical protein
VRRILIFSMGLERRPRHKIGAYLYAQRVRVVPLMKGIRVGESVAVCLSRLLSHRLRLGEILEVNVGLFVRRIIMRSMRLW